MSHMRMHYISPIYCWRFSRTSASNWCICWYIKSWKCWCVLGCPAVHAVWCCDRKLQCEVPTEEWLHYWLYCSVHQWDACCTARIRTWNKLQSVSHIHRFKWQHEWLLWLGQLHNCHGYTVTRWMREFVAAPCRHVKIYIYVYGCMLSLYIPFSGLSLLLCWCMCGCCWGRLHWRFADSRYCWLFGLRCLLQI